MIQVIIVEDESAIARGLSVLISQGYPDFEVVAICRNGKEGLQKILELRPELVFLDINMPVMNGLDMLAALKEKGFHTHFVILTGYAEFEYARSAISLGVSDYLLKPVSPDTLDEIMNSCREQHQSTLRSLQREYLQRNILQKEPHEDDENPLAGYNCTLLFFFVGSMCGNVYNESVMQSRSKTLSSEMLKKIHTLHNIWLHTLNGYYYNETVFALVSLKDTIISEHFIAEQLSEFLAEEDSFISLIISEPAEDGKNIFELTRNTHLFALFNNRFSYNSIIKYKPLENKEMCVSQEIIRLSSCIPHQLTYDILKELLHSMCTYWESKKVTQFQLISDLRYLINIRFQEKSREHLLNLDPEEMVSSSNNYRELEQTILYEFARAEGLDDAYIHPDETLAKQVRSWLDKNFTNQITYKLFQDIFGYNEKYLSSLFKAEFGISPSKYIGELRLNMAKKLIENNPDIILKDVADMTGFSDSFYFSRVFKAHEGISPSDYKSKWSR
ncbi:MAG: response regulator transcription factor [Lachnospiraceae bacterium]